MSNLTNDLRLLDLSLRSVPASAVDLFGHERRFAHVRHRRGVKRAFDFQKHLFIKKRAILRLFYKIDIVNVYAKETYIRCI